MGYKIMIRSALAIGSALPIAMAAANEEIELTVVSWGGAYTESQTKAYHEPWMVRNPHIRIINNDSSARALSLLRTGAHDFDLIDMLPSDAQVACDEGLLVEIDADEILAPAPDGTPASRDFLPGSLHGDCFIPQIVYSTVIAYNPELFPDDAQPASVADFFDVENFPGLRAIQDRPAANLEWALYADGVPIEDIYEVLSTPEGVDRAFAKLESIKDHLTFWIEGAHAPQMLADREVAFATGYNGRMFAAAEEEGHPIRIIWDGQVVEWDGWAIPATTEQLDAVLEFLYFATDSQRLADQARYISYGPARASSADKVSTHAGLGIEMGPHIPTHPDNYETAIVLDNDFWVDYRDELAERFASWIIQ